MCSSATAANDIDPPITRQVCNEAGVSINVPARRARAEVDGDMWGPKGSISFVAANVNIMRPKSYDIWKSISCSVTKEAGMVIEAPTPTVSAVAKTVERSVGRFENPSALFSRNEDTIIPKSNNVTPSNTSDVR